MMVDKNVQEKQQENWDNKKSLDLCRFYRHLCKK